MSKKGSDLFFIARETLKNKSDPFLVTLIIVSCLFQLTPCYALEWTVAKLSLRAPKGRSNLSFVPINRDPDRVGKIASVASLPRNDASKGISQQSLEWNKLHNEADKSALADVLASVEANPNSIDNLYLLGLVYLNARKDKEAKEAFERISSKDSSIIEADWGRAEVLRREHKLEESKQLLRKVMAANPRFTPAYITLAYIRYIQLDFNAVLRLAGKVIKEGRDNACLSNYVRALLLIGGTKGILAHYGGPVSKLINGTQVFSYLKKARELQPDSAAVMFGLGSFYVLAPKLAGGDLEKAEAYLNRSIEADPLFADAYVRLAQVYKAKGDNAKSLEYLARALKIDPENELAIDIKSGKCRFICR